EDRGPATKFLYVLEEFMTNRESFPTGFSSIIQRPNEPVLIICDDDHLYSSRLVDTLLEWHTIIPNAALGLRGWRVREDLEWGVEKDEIGQYVIHGVDLINPYQVGVVRPHPNCI